MSKVSCAHGKTEMHRTQRETEKVCLSFLYMWIRMDYVNIRIFNVCLQMLGERMSRSNNPI